MQNDADDVKANSSKIEEGSIADDVQTASPDGLKEEGSFNDNNVSFPTDLQEQTDQVHDDCNMNLKVGNFTLLS